MEPKPRSDKWVKDNDDHAKAVADRLKWGTNYVLIGSSHISRFTKTSFNRSIWEEYFGPEYVTFANGGDRIENTLWMIDRYNLPGGCDVAVVCIGGNNISKNGTDPKMIAKGIKEVAVQLPKNNKERLVLLCGIFPGFVKPIKVITKVNNTLMDITRNCKNHFLFATRFQRLGADQGRLKEKLDYGDHLHLNGSGYKLFARYIVDISQLSEKFKESCTVPYVRSNDADTTLRYGITEPFVFYTTDCDPGVARGPWYKAPPPPPHFNKVSCTTPSSQSGISKYIGLPGTHVVNHLGASVVYGGVS